MPQTNIRQNFTEMDFDEIRQSIIEHLKTKTEFKDFDFEGPAISLLIDALAYTQTYMATHANMAIAETFIQSARLRENVVSKAKELGYTPHSMSAAVSDFRIRFVDPEFIDEVSYQENNTLMIPRGTQFSGSGKNFVVIEDYPLTYTGGGVYEADISVYEGGIRQHTVNIQGNGPSEKLTIPVKDIDITLLRVGIIDSSQSSNIDYWFNSDDVVSIGPESRVFFVQEGPSGFYEVYFGDNIIGANPGSGRQVTLEYFATKGPEGNGVINFEMNSASRFNNQNGTDVDLGDFSIVDGSVIRSRNGGERETEESIRHAAPLIYQAQNRAVTKEDYTAILQNEFSFIEALNVWGGEDNDPPFYGRVFISIKPETGDTLTSVVKSQIEERLKQRYSVMAIDPRVVDADFIYVRPISVVTYNPEMTTKTRGELAGMIRTESRQFFHSNVRYFDETLRHSKLVNMIDSTEESIIGNLTNFRLGKRISPTPNRLVSYEMKFFNELKPNTIRSKTFTFLNREVEFRDNGKGEVNLFINGVLTRSNVGTVDYEKGIVNLSRYIFRTEQGFVFEMFAEPKNLNIKSSRNALIRYDNNHEISVVSKKQND